MPEGQVLEFTHVTKRFNEVTAVSDFSARVEPGAVTAFLGPNGAGKTTTLRILLGQVRATSGTATIGGAAYAELRQPLRTIGAVLEETVYRPRRTAERQLTIAAKANGIPLARVGEVLSLVGLEGEGDSRIGGFSLGMRQRLSVAHALLGDPGALVFDEPANGLDPEGIRWMRLLMRRLADEGRTVLVSSHVLSEVEQVADNVLVLSKGQLVLASGIETLADPKGGSVIVDAADRGALTAALSAAGFDIEVLRSGLTVRGGDAGTVGAVAADAGIALSTLVQRGPTLEDVFIDLMRGGGRRGGRTDETPQLAAPAPAHADAPAEADAPADDAGAAGAPADSVVAIPVAAAAAWAAEAAAAPAGEVAAEDLAASVVADGAGQDQDSADHDQNSADQDDAEELFADAEASAEGGDREEAPDADDVPTPAGITDGETVGDTADADARADGVLDETSPGDDEDGDDEDGEETPAPSFDEILFGAPAPVAAAEVASSGEPRHSVSEIFTSHQPEASDVIEHASDDDDHAGVEIFADLDGADTGSVDAQPDGAQPDDSDDVEGDDPEADPRSAAVSSMLAAAARAYYEDEPKDYPLTTEGQEDAESATEGAHWSVASTGVIDTVPLASDDATADGDAGTGDAETEQRLPDEPASTDESPAEGGDDESDHHEGETSHG